MRSRRVSASQMRTTLSSPALATSLLSGEYAVDSTMVASAAAGLLAAPCRRLTGRISKLSGGSLLSPPAAGLAFACASLFLVAFGACAQSDANGTASSNSTAGPRILIQEASLYAFMGTFPDEVTV